MEQCKTLIRTLKDAYKAEKLLALADDVTPEELAKHVANMIDYNEEILDMQRKVALQILKHKELVRNSEGRSATDILTSYLYKDTHPSGKTIQNVPLEFRYYSHYNRQFAAMGEHFKKHVPKWFGLSRDPAAQEGVVRELIAPGSTGDSDFKAMATAWKKGVTDPNYQMYKALGGKGGYLESFGLPVSLDTLKLRGLSKEQFVSYLTDNGLDRQTIKNLFGWDDRELDIALMWTHRNMVEGNERPLPKELTRRNENLTRRHLEHRLIHFKKNAAGADGYIKLHKEYGNPNFIANMQRHMDQMAREFAALETFGPTPDAFIRWMGKHHINDKGGLKGVKLLARDFDYFMGRQAPDLEDRRWADTFAGIRNFMVATKLGRAVIPAVADMGTKMLQAGMNDIPLLRTMRSSLVNLRPGIFKDTADVLNQIGMGLEWTLDQAMAAHRVSEVTGSGILAKAADFTIRASGLQRWTQAQKASFTFDLAANAAHFLKGRLGKNKKINEVFARYGISENEMKWLADNAITKFSTKRYKSVELLDIFKVRDPDLATKLTGMLTEETRYAILEPNLKVKSMWTQGQQAGTFWGELMRFAGQFKSFATTVATTHLSKMRHTEGAWSKGTYAGSLIVGGTILGMVSLWVDDLIRGREPRPINAKNLAAAIMRSGVTSIIGDTFDDVLREGVSRTVGDLMLGPVGGEAAYAIDTMVSAGKNIFDIEEAFQTATSRTTRQIARNLPGRLPYTTLLIDRFVGDQIMKLGNPDWDDHVHQLETRLENDIDTEYYWRPGETSPR